MGQGIATIGIWASLFLWVLLANKIEGPIGVLIAFHLISCGITTIVLWSIK